ncbi:DeoR/GlpR family DNA-binding transcription regulator [Tropicimonas sp. TH_r6]|uniref:DeoR/GlpR family DNA-binding transcription regulator n=1 Tax=Tropicimonas sp. TH_r6 TaxID=3082085 RepID=UPI002955D8EB|nr:DeoR/GlpR family DNA-binding transcription regulator [Tropicimonas sp. TH_r6]MDV7141372.1 DeoR/GlpR family DNA-binding transcription regulator [Tropicimonas sp. TH_r6]
MAQSFRQTDILELARKQGKVTVEDLVARFGVTHQTIRRDLSDLADAGELERVHGGAMLPSGVSNLGYEDRRDLNTNAKAEIAARCAATIPNDCSVFLNIGTSTEAVARALLQHRNMMVITNNINVANILVANPEIDIMVAGGKLRRSDGGLTGATTRDVIEQFKVDIAVIGCSALDHDGDLLDFDIEEVHVSQTILQQARASYLVADHSKFQRSAPARIASLGEIDSFFTDAPLTASLDRLCRDWGTDVVLT